MSRIRWLWHIRGHRISENEVRQMVEAGRVGIMAILDEEAGVARISAMYGQQSPGGPVRLGEPGSGGPAS